MDTSAGPWGPRRTVGRHISETVWPIANKFGKMAQYDLHDPSDHSKFEILKIKNAPYRCAMYDRVYRLLQLTSQRRKPDYFFAFDNRRYRDLVFYWNSGANHPEAEAVLLNTHKILMFRWSSHYSLSFEQKDVLHSDKILCQIFSMSVTCVF